MRRVKILLLGDSSVGKSSMIHRITDNAFKHSLVATVGVDYKVRKMHINGEIVQVWHI
jgi:small GTP-binding protein